MSAEFKYMQVINITPDSFSDGGKYNSFEKIQSCLDECNTWGTSIIDIGAESTAPFNSKIDATEELKRFEECFLPLLKEGIISDDITLSIDTYRPSVFRKVYQEIRKYLPTNKIIFNDVSGVIDEELIELLLKIDDFDYVYSHTGVANREHTSDHMDHLIHTEDKMIDELARYFARGLDLLSKEGITHRIILDPCFGFSKTSEQNLEIIKDIHFLIDSFSSHKRWLLGVSRKSFFKRLVIKDTIDTAKNYQNEYLHTATLSRWMNQIKSGEIFIRGHDPSVFWAAKTINP